MQMQEQLWIDVDKKAVGGQCKAKDFGKQIEKLREAMQENVC